MDIEEHTKFLVWKYNEETNNDIDSEKLTPLEKWMVNEHLKIQLQFQNALKVTLETLDYKLPKKKE